jgi:Protein of unknown function with HXXEE motif
MTKLEVNFLALVAVQAAHSIEEYLGRLWEVFPPAAFITGLVSPNRERGFIFINVALLAFGLWCFFWPVRRRWTGAGGFVGFWVVIEIINGIGHVVWTLRQGMYTPGVLTAPVLFVLAVLLTWQYTRGAQAELIPKA